MVTGHAAAGEGAGRKPVIPHALRHTSAAAQMRDRATEGRLFLKTVPCLRSSVARCGAHGMTGVL